mgnify:CR=1 FL=1
MPILFALLLLLLWYAFKNGEFQKGLNFMFAADFSKLTSQSVLTAMGHAFFTLSLGMGTVMVYGSYMSNDQSISNAVIVVAGLDTLIALIAGMAIFHWCLPVVWRQALGQAYYLKRCLLPFQACGAVPSLEQDFFLVAIAALSSSISLIEPGIAWLEKLGSSRLLATVGLSLLCWLGGVASIYSSEVFNRLDY